MRNDAPEVETVSLDVWEKLGSANENMTACVNTNGISMWPLLRAYHDSVHLVYPKRELMIGDIVLFHREDGKEIAHRICWMDDTSLDTLGDNCDKTDGKFLRSQVFGLVTHVCRNGRLIHVDTKFWRFYGRFMIWSNPVRMFIRNKIFRPMRRFAIKVIKGK